MKYWVLYYCIYFSNISVYSQTINDPIFINILYQPSNEIPLKASAAHLKILEINAMGPAWKPIRKLNWYHAAYFKSSILENSLSANSYINTNFYDIRYSSILRYQMDSTWEFIALPRVLARSDFNQSLSSRDIFPYLVLLANYSVNKNPNFKIGLGVALNSDFNSNAILPTGTLFYNSSKFRVEVNYPNAYFLYKLSSNAECGFYGNIDASISHFRYSNLEYLKSFQYFIAPTIVHRVHKQFFAHLKVGYASTRAFSFLDSDFNQVGSLNTKLEPNIFFKLGVSYRIKD